MKPPVKTLVFLTIFFFSLATSFAQLKINTSHGIAFDVRKVIDDYPNHFDNIRGELIIENPQSTDYQCNFKVTGAEECTITRYSTKKKPVFSWQALMLTTDNFDEAKRKFHSLYNDLSTLPQQTGLTKGLYESPEEAKKFTSVLFPVESANKLSVELVMEAEGMEWKVKVLVYDRDRDDDQQGEAGDS